MVSPLVFPRLDEYTSTLANVISVIGATLVLATGCEVFVKSKSWECSLDF